MSSDDWLMDELMEELEALLCAPVINFYQYKQIRDQILQRHVYYTQCILDELADPPQPELPPPPPPPRLIWRTEQPQPIRIRNVELLDSTFGHWSLEIREPSTDHHPC